MKIIVKDVFDASGEITFSPYSADHTHRVTENTSFTLTATMPGSAGWGYEDIHWYQMADGSSTELGFWTYAEYPETSVMECSVVIDTPHAGERLDLCLKLSDGRTGQYSLISEHAAPKPPEGVVVWTHAPYIPDIAPDSTLLVLAENQSKDISMYAYDEDDNLFQGDARKTSPPSCGPAATQTSCPWNRRARPA